MTLNPGERTQLLAEPRLLDNAVEEMLRRHGLSNTGRELRQNVERKGATSHAIGVAVARIVRAVTHDERVHMLGKMVVSGLRDASNRTRGGSQ